MFRIVKKNDRKELNPFDQLFGNFYTTDLWDTGYKYPAVDIYEKEGLVHIDAEVPGISKENLKVELEDGVLTVSGEIRQENEEKEKCYFRTERKYGTFKRSFTLGDGVDDEKINASFDNGILKITVPVKEEEKKVGKQIEIR